jgi:hypothetical protein
MRNKNTSRGDTSELPNGQVRCTYNSAETVALCVISQATNSMKEESTTQVYPYY